MNGLQNGLQFIRVLFATERFHVGRGGLVVLDSHTGE